MTDLITIFNEVRSCYFPRWDIKRQWKIKTWNMPGALCRLDKKLIEFSDGYEDGLVIIHEICHAVTHKGDHGLKWQNRFLKAADIAISLGNIDLGNKIKTEVKQYQDQLKFIPERRLNARDIQNEIEDATLDLPSSSFIEIVEAVAHQHLMTSEELLKYYRVSAKKAFDEAHEIIDADEQLREKFAKGKGVRYLSKFGKVFPDVH